MHLNLLLTLTCLLATTTTTAHPNPNPTSPTARDSLRPRYWDLRLQKPPCTNSTNPSLTLYHRSGTTATACSSLLTDRGPDGTPIDLEAVDSISWKSPDPSRRFDLCLFRDGECADATGVRVVRGGWEVCYPFEGWMGWRVVEGGGGCF